MGNSRNSEAFGCKIKWSNFFLKKKLSCRDNRMPVCGCEMWLFNLSGETKHTRIKKQLKTDGFELWITTLEK